MKTDNILFKDNIKNIIYMKTVILMILYSFENYCVYFSSLSVLVDTTNIKLKL